MRRSRLSAWPSNTSLPGRRADGAGRAHQRYRPGAGEDRPRQSRLQHAPAGLAQQQGRAGVAAGRPRRSLRRNRSSPSQTAGRPSVTWLRRDTSPRLHQRADARVIGGVQLPIGDVGRHWPWMPLAMVLRQATPTRPCPQRLGAHQPFDLVQPAPEACSQDIVPDPPGAIGATALQEARPHLGSHLLIRHSMAAWRPVQPSMKARARDAQC